MKIPVPYSKPFIATFLSLVALLAIASCAESESATEEPTATATLSSYELTQEAGQSEYETCYKPTEELIVDIARNIKGSEIGMRAFFLVRHSYTTNSWTLAAEVEGRGFEGDEQFALFDVIGLRADAIRLGNIQPFNDLAIEHTSLPSSFATAGDEVFQSVFEDNQTGIEILYGCIRQELNKDPDTPVYRAE